MLPSILAWATGGAEQRACGIGEVDQSCLVVEIVMFQGEV